MLLWLSYIVMFGAVPQTFASCASTFPPPDYRSNGKPVFLTATVLLNTVFNIAGVSTIARTERYVVAINVALSMLFVAVGTTACSRHGSGPSQWSTPVAMVTGGMIIFRPTNVSNTSSPPPRMSTIQGCPRVYYNSVFFVIVLYLFVAVVSVEQRR